MAPSHPSIQSLTVAGAMTRLRFWADSEKSYTLQGSAALSEAAWNTITNIPTRLRPQLIEVTENMGTGHRFYRLNTP